MEWHLACKQHNVGLVQCIAYHIQYGFVVANSSSPAAQYLGQWVVLYVTTFASNITLCALYQQKCSERNVSSHLPATHQLIEWDTLWYMLEAAMTMQAVISDVLQHIQADQALLKNHWLCLDSDYTKVLMEQEWMGVQALHSFIMPLYNSTCKLTRYPYPPISLLLPTYCDLVRHLQQYIDNIPGNNAWGLSQCASTLLDVLNEYKPRLYKTHILAATFLDPRTKSVITEFDLSTLVVVSMITMMRQSFYAPHLDHLMTAVAEDLPSAGNINNASVECTPICDHTRPSSEGSISLEIDRWLACCTGFDVTTSDGDMYKWMRDNEMVYPCLSFMAKDYLAIPASSAANERVFQKAPQYLYQECNKLDDTDLKNCSLLQSYEEFLSQVIDNNQ
jgi:hAT family C-terminal dimerisation region